MKYLFNTSESDSKTIYRDNGKYFERRYGLSPYEISEQNARIEAWFECNRRGKFSHLRRCEPGQIPTLTNPEAQEFIVNNFLHL